MPFSIFTVYALNVAKKTQYCVDVRKQVLNTIYKIRIGVLSSLILSEGVKYINLQSVTMECDYPAMI